VTHDATHDVPRPEEHKAVDESQEEDRDEEERDSRRDMVVVNRGE
jgi:hypothetical protein